MANRSGIGFRISLIVNNNKQNKYLIFINLEKHLLVRDIVQHIRDTFSFKTNFKLFVNECILPEAESIFVIQPEDTLNVCFDENDKTYDKGLSNKSYKPVKNKFTSTLDGIGDCLKLLLDKKSELEKESKTEQPVMKAPVCNKISRHEDDHSESYDSTMVEDTTTDGSLIAVNTPPKKRKRTRSRKTTLPVNCNGTTEISNSLDSNSSDRKKYSKKSSGQHIYFNEGNENNSPSVNGSLPSTKADKEKESDWKSTLLNLTTKSTGQKVFDRSMKLDSNLPTTDEAIPVNEISQLVVGGTIAFQVLTLSDNNSPITSSRIIGKVNSVSSDEGSINLSIIENKEVFESEQWKSLQQDSGLSMTETEEIQLNWLNLIKPTFC